MALLPWIAWALWASVASTATAQFNTTVKFTLTSMDPMVDLDAASQTWAGVPFTLDDATGYRTSTGRSSGNAGCWFVASAFDVQGSVNWKGGAPPERLVELGLNHPASAFLYYPGTNYYRRNNDTKQFNISAGTGPDLLSLSQLDLRAYELRFSFSPYTELVFHNITVDVPILTQAPSLEALDQQAKFVSAAIGQQLNSIMSLERITELNELKAMNQSRGETPPPIAFDDPPALQQAKFYDDAIVLRNLTELHYEVPANTTLIRVYGPVGSNDLSWYGSQCYAALDPRPSWWRTNNLPLSASLKAVNATNQTMFLLPVDPAVRTTLKIGTYGLQSSCFVSGVSSYPFHYNYTLANLIAGQSTDSKSGSTNKVGIGVGVGVGVGVPLLLALVAVWWLRRRRREKKAVEQPDVQPYAISEKDLYRTASWAPHNDPRAGAPGPSQEQAAAGSSEPAPRLLVQEQDAGNAVEYLPPVYQEEWQLGPLTAASTPPPAAADAPALSPELSSPTSPSPDPSSRLPVGPVPVAASSSGNSATDRSAPLHEEYKRAFIADDSGVAGKGEAADAGPSTERPAPPPQQEGNLKEEYGRFLGNA